MKKALFFALFLTGCGVTAQLPTSREPSGDTRMEEPSVPRPEPEKQPDPLPRITTDFDTGSIGRVRHLDRLWVPVSGGDSLQIVSYHIRSRWDPRNPIDTGVPQSSRWFHFRMEGVRGKMIFLTIPNTELLRPFYSYDGQTYHRFEAVEAIHPQTIFKHFERDTAYIAYFYPYTHARHAAKMEQWGAHPATRVDTIGRSGAGLPITMLTVDDTPAAGAKKHVWMHARVHPSEAPAAWHLEALVDELLDDSPLSTEIRRHAVFHIVPETNPDGVLHGYSRSTPAGVNIEVDWGRPDSLTTPEIRTLKRTIDSLVAARPLDVVLNLHSQSPHFVTYWIHTAKSSSQAIYRRKMLLSALTIDHTSRYRPVDQRFSELAPRYAEGWSYDRFGDRTLAITFETPYTYYNNDPQGEWVSLENLAELAHSSLLALSDLLDLGGTERLFADNDRAKTSGWNRKTDAKKLYFGANFLTATAKGSTATFSFPAAEAGRYEVLKWVPGALGTKFSENQNRWVRITTITHPKDGTLTYRYRAAQAGEVVDAVLLRKVISDK